MNNWDLFVLLILLLLLCNIKFTHEAFKDDISIYCINLDYRRDNWWDIEEQAKKNNINIIRFPAVNGKQLAQSVMKTIHNNKSQRKYTRGEIGCYLSHCSIWRVVFDKRLKYALIIEDDIILVDHFKERLEEILLEAKSLDWDIILLGRNEHNNKKNVSVSGSLEKTKETFYGTQGYLISNKGAKKLIEYCEYTKIVKPLDVTLYNIKNLNIYNTKEKLVLLNPKFQYSDTQGII